jgi:hypothetical protein
MTFSGSDWLADKQHALDTVAWDLQPTINPTVKHLLCHLAFNQDMIFLSCSLDRLDQHSSRMAKVNGSLQ